MPVAFLALPLLIAFPVILLMTVWAVVTLARVLFPERLARKPKVYRSELIEVNEMALPVRSRDIVEGIHRQAAHSLEEEPHPVKDAEQEFEPLFGDLWLRRN